MKQEQAADLALDAALLEVVAPKGFAGLTKSDLAEAVQVFLRELERNASFPWSAAIRTVHGIITKWRRKNGV